MRFILTRLEMISTLPRIPSQQEILNTRMDTAKMVTNMTMITITATTVIVTTISQIYP